MKLTASKSILAQINELKSSKDFKSPEEIQKKLSELQSRITTSQIIEKEMEKTQSDPDYLTDQEIKVCQKMIKDVEESKQFFQISLNINF
jgi:HEPN domain-containing protein